MKKHTLTGQKRTETGRAAKKLRKQGKLPATIYGKKTKSVSVQVAQKDFDLVYKAAGETGLVEFTVDGSLHPVLIHNVQKHPVDGSALHVEFFQVDLKEKVHTKVPLEFTGEAPAVAQRVGALLTLLDEVEVEALPTDLPEKILVDVTQLSEVGQEVKVTDLKAPTGVAILADAELTVVKVDALVSKEAEEQAAADAAAAAAAQAEAAPGEAPAEGEKPAATPEPTAEAPKEESK